MPLELGDDAITVGYVGGKAVTAGYVGSSQVFGGAAQQYSVSGTITDLVTNGNVTGSYSVSGTSGSNQMFTVTVGADDGYEMTAATCGAITVSGLGSSITAPSSWGLTSGQCTGVFNVTIPSASEVDNFSVSGAAALESNPTFTCSDWTGTVSVNSNGGVTTTNGNAQSVSVFSDNCNGGNTCSSVDCNITLIIQVPSSGYSNANQNLTCGPYTRTQPQTGSNFNSSSDWNGSVSFTSGGSAVISSGNMTNVTVSPSTVASNSSCNTINRNVTVSGTVSDITYCNNGSSVSISYVAVQNAGGAQFSWSPSMTVAVDGTVTPDYDGILNGTISPSSFADRSSNCESIQRCATISGTIPAGFCQSGTTSQQVCASQQGGQIDFPVNTWNGSVSVSTNGGITFNAGSNLSGAYISAATSPCTTSSCPSLANDCTSQTRMFTITADVDEQSSFCNAGDEISFTYATTQVHGKSDLVHTCVGYSVNALGQVTCPSGWNCDPNSFPVVKDAITRTSTVSRTATAIYCNNGTLVTGTCSDTQEASAANSLSVNQSQLQFDGSGQPFADDTIEVTVSPDNSFSVSDNQSWISTSVSGTTVTVSVDNNENQSNRTGTVTITHTLDSSLSNAVTITQTGDV